MNVGQLSAMWKGAISRAVRPPYPDLQPTVEWQVNGHCNYDCAYCIQSPASRVGTPSESTVRGIVDGFAGLPGQWEIKMSGGEPFAWKGFVRLAIPELVERTRHTLSVLTNFSAPVDTLQRFCQLTGDRLRITSASFHPDTVALAAFLEKAVAYREMRQMWNPHSSFVVNVVLVPGSVHRHFEYREQLELHGFRYFPQLMKINGGVYPYDERDLKLIDQVTGGSREPRDVNRAPSYEGLRCEAGAWYFVVDQTGEAYTCRTGKRFLDVNERARLGNLVSGTFSLRRQGGLCPYPICPCTVPVNRGIVRIEPTARQRELTRGD
ncbi:MAG: radical SAM protein [Planctomycetales bacterium]|nr:radical SAM protein [Planctomycetales bacterium]